MNLKKFLLSSIATTAAAGTLFASDLQVAEAAAYETPVDESGNVILGGAPDVNPENSNAKPGSSNQFELSLDRNGVPTTVSNNDKQKSETVQNLKQQNLNEGFKTKEEAENAAKKVLEEDEVNKSYTVSQGANSNHYFSLSPNEPAKTTNDQQKEDTVEDLKEQNASDGFKTKAEAEDAAKKVLEKDEVNKSYTVSQGANSNYYFLLSPNEAEKVNEEDKKTETVQDLKDQNANEGFKTKAEAEDAAKKVLEKDEVNKSYTVSQGANDNYYFLLSPNEAAATDEKDPKTEENEKPATDKEDTKKETKGQKSADKKEADKKVAAKKSDAVKANGKKQAAKRAKSTLPKTGAVATAAPAVLGLALASVGTAFAFGKKKEDK